MEPASSAAIGNSVCSECAAVQRERTFTCWRCGAPMLVCRRVRATDSSIVYEVEHPGGLRIIKMLRNRTDPLGIRRYERERQVLSLLSDRVPTGVIPRIVAADLGILVTEKLPGRRVHDLLWWPTSERLLAVRKAGETARLLAAIRTDDVTLPSYIPTALAGPLLQVKDLLPPWLGSEAQAAVADGNRSTFVHGDYVPTNWLWDGNLVAALDFEWAHMGSPEEDAAMAWARLRLAGIERGLVNDRLASEVLHYWQPTLSTRWMSYALVKTVAIILARMRSRPDPLRPIKLRLLRRSLKQILPKLEHEASS